MSGISALNLDLVYEVDDLGTLRRRGFLLAPGGECGLPPDEFERLLGILAQEGRLAGRDGGGSGANTIVALARMGFATCVVGRVGVDGEGTFLLHKMEGVDVSQVKREGRTGVCLVVLDRRRDRSLVIQPNTNDGLCYDEVDLEYVFSCRYLHVSSFAGDGPLEVQRRLVSAVPTRIKVSFDPGDLYARRGLAEVRPLVERSSIIFATDREICILTGRDDFKSGCETLLSMGPDLVVCKRGGQGVFLLSATGAIAFEPREETEVVDNTGVGDVYNAGFLAGMLLERPLHDCLSFAHRVAVKSLGGYGRATYPDKRDLMLLEEG